MHKSTSLSEDDSMYRAIFDATSDAMFIHEASGKIIDANECACVTYGYDRATFLRTKIGDLSQGVSPYSQVEAEQHIRRAMDHGPHSFEWMCKRSNGELFWADVALRAFEVGGNRLVIASLRDISVRKQTEETLALSQRQLLEAQRIAKLGHYSFNLGRGTWTCSKALDDIFGIDEGTGRTYEVWVSVVHPEEREEMIRYFAEDVLAKGRTFNREYRIRRLSDGVARWVHGTGDLCRDSNGNILEMFGTIQDITERKELEFKFLEAQKMQAIGQLAGGVAHDFNNILAATMMHLSLLAEDTSLGADARETVNELQADARRAAALTRQLLMFGRRSVVRMAPLDVNASIENLLKMLGRLIGEHIELVFRPAGELPLILGDTGMLEQALMNLAVNARDAMAFGGVLTISTQTVEITGEQAASNPRSRPGQFVCISVADTGCGMSETTLKHIFEPFFTTKAPGKGTGLGLATLYGIVLQHNGWVEVQSESGRGALFRLYFPASETRPATPAAHAQKEQARGGTETILLVEDDSSVRNVAVQFLRRFGYSVLEAANGPDAIRIWEENKSKINLLFSDVVMPDSISGIQLAELLRKKRPDLKVILTSGYNAEMTERMPSGVKFLPKPYETALLWKIIRECLDAS